MMKKLRWIHFHVTWWKLRVYPEKNPAPICLNFWGSTARLGKERIFSVAFCNCKIGIQSGKVGWISLSLSNVEGQLLLNSGCDTQNGNEGTSSTMCSQESTMEVGLVQLFRSECLHSAFFAGGGWLSPCSTGRFLDAQRGDQGGG